LALSSWFTWQGILGLSLLCVIKDMLTPHTAHMTDWGHLVSNEGGHTVPLLVKMGHSKVIQLDLPINNRHKVREKHVSLGKVRSSEDVFLSCATLLWMSNERPRQVYA
jgi:hypothetical protein